MSAVLGLDTSNYTTSAAIWDGGDVTQVKRLLPVRAGERGLRQSDAVFHHVRQLPELLEELRGQGVTDLKDVQYAVLETSGQVSVLLRSEAQPVTPRQLSLNVTEQLLPVLLINDGRLLRDNMKKMDVDDAWLRQQLKREHLTDPSQVFLLSLDQGGNVICQAKEDV